MNRTRRVLSAAAATLTLVTVVYMAATRGAGDALGMSAGTGGDKVLYLTFDDGPGDETSAILDVLDEYDAKAVFFALGQNLAANREIGRRILAEGHVLANHTWNHANLTGLGTTERQNEIGRTAELLARLGSESPCVRPPHGATNAEVRDALNERGLKQVLWNVDTEDWTDPGTDAIADRLLDADSGEVVLLHDGGGDRTQTVAALRRALPELIAQGYRFEIVPGC